MVSVQKQSGVVLIICLVMLLVVTILGLASMSGTSSEMKMASAFRDRAVAMEVAEETLVVAENWISNTNLHQSNFIDGCTGSNCFSAACNNGLCAFYNPSDPFLSSTDLAACKDRMELPETSVWKWSGATGEPNLWKNDSKSVQVVPSNPGATVNARYIIEFMCYVDKTAANDCEVASDENCAPQFRITAMAKGLTNNSVVMLQSMYKKVN